MQARLCLCPRSSRHQQAGFARSVQARPGRPVRDWEFFLTAVPSYLAVLVQAQFCSRPAAHPVKVRLVWWWPFVAARQGVTSKEHTNECVCGGPYPVYGATGGGHLRSWQPFRRRSETPWQSCSKCGSALAIRLRLCVFMQTLVRPLLELTLPKGELPGQCDRPQEGAPEENSQPPDEGLHQGGDLL